MSRYAKRPVSRMHGPSRTSFRNMRMEKATSLQILHDAFREPEPVIRTAVVPACSPT